MKIPPLDPFSFFSFLPIFPPYFKLLLPLEPVPLEIFSGVLPGAFFGFFEFLSLVVQNHYLFVALLEQRGYQEDRLYLALPDSFTFT